MAIADNNANIMFKRVCWLLVRYEFGVLRLSYRNLMV
jgi:hypothetical protein